MDVLAKSFVQPRPQRLPADVEHRRKVPWDTRRPCFCGRHATRVEHQLRIPRRRHPERLRKQRGALDVVRPVNGINAVKDRDLQPCFAGRFLNGGNQLVPFVDGQREVFHVQDRADAVLDDRFVQLRRVDLKIGVFAVGDHPDFELRHLADLLFERHPLDEIVDPARQVGARRRQRAE